MPGVPNDGIELRVENDIPAGIDTAAIVAETRNGTLLVRMPKSAAAKTRRIVVRPRTGD